MNEVDLGKHIISHLKNKNYEIYQEVDNGNRGIDVVGVSNIDKHIIAVELKLSFNLKVIEQAFDNRMFCHYSYLAVPSAKYSSSRYFAIDVCRDYGIGIIEYLKTSGKIRELVKPCLNKHPESLKLYKDKGSYSIAGSPDGKRWTPFKQTCIYIEEYVKNNKGCSISELVKNIDHHYSSPYSAKSTIRNRIKSGIIKNVKIVDNKLYLNI